MNPGEIMTETSCPASVTEHRRTDPTVETLTIRQALDAVGLHAPARIYPEPACAEVFVLVLLRLGRRLPASTVLRRGAEVGLPAGAIRRAKTRLGVISTRQRGGWAWQLPQELMEDDGVERLNRPWLCWRG